MAKGMKEKKALKTKLLSRNVASSDTYDDKFQNEYKMQSEKESIDYDSDYNGPPPSSNKCFPAKRCSKASISPRSVMSAPDLPFSEDLVPESLPACTVGIKYSMRSAIGDGGARQADGPTVMERRDLNPNGCHMKVSHWSENGCRAYMEDRYAIEELGSVIINAEEEDCKTAHSNKKKSLQLSWLGVFDGHGGGKASQFCCDQLSAYVRNQYEFPWDLGTAMKHAYHMIDKDFTRTGYTDGTTACSCIIVGGKKIVCANAGDSRAIVIKEDGSVFKLSRDHKPGVPCETKRITDLGGKVLYFGRWRVEGILAVSRGIGDGALKPYITADPDVCEYNIEKDDLFLVIATDGIWDVLNNSQVAQHVISETCTRTVDGFQCHPQKLIWAARKLCKKARENRSSDNKCAIIVDLNKSSYIP